MQHGCLQAVLARDAACISVSLGCYQESAWASASKSPQTEQLQKQDDTLSFGEAQRKS